MWIRALTLLFIFSITSVSAQKIKVVEGEYTYYAPDNISLEEAKRIAKERAKIQAMADEFGTIVSQSNSSARTIEGDISTTTFTFLGGEDIKGEWIDDTEEPQFEINRVDHLTLIKCRVKGKAREIKRAAIAYEFYPLRNGTDKRFISKEFIDGDDLFLYFLSPADGYLCVFLLDEAAQTVYSILPYRNDSNSSYFIERNKEHILFSINNATKESRNLVDEYTLTCDKPMEFYTLYILFSPEIIYKGNGYNTGIEDIPDNIGFTEFRSRLGKLLAKNPDIQFSQTSIKVSK